MGKLLLVGKVAALGVALYYAGILVAAAVVAGLLLWALLASESAVLGD